MWTKVAGSPASRVPSFDIDPRLDNIASVTASGLLVTPPGQYSPRPHARLYRSTTQAIVTDTDIALRYDVAQADDWSMARLNTDRSVIPFIEGVYLVSASMRWAASALGWRIMGITLNGGRLAAHTHWTLNSEVFAAAVSTIVRATPSDAIGVSVVHTAGSTLNTSAADASTDNSANMLSVVFLGEL